MKAEITSKKVVYEIPGMDQLTMLPAVEYRRGEPRPLTMDLYYPTGTTPGATGEELKPAVLIVLGYPDVDVSTPFGCQFREMGMITSWARLFAGSGMVGIVYETRNPVEDVGELLSFLRTSGRNLGIDQTRVAVWASSGNVPVALSVLMKRNVFCGVLCYGFMLDLDGTTYIAEAAKTYRFANPTAGKGIADLANDTALLIVRAGHDQFAGLNEAMDRFIAAALGSNLPLTFINHATGPHGFGFSDDSEESKGVIRAILAFLNANLGRSRGQQIP